MLIKSNQKTSNQGEKLILKYYLNKTGDAWHEVWSEKMFRDSARGDEQVI